MLKSYSFIMYVTPNNEEQIENCYEKGQPFEVVNNAKFLISRIQQDTARKTAVLASSVEISSSAITAIEEMPEFISWV